jgi:hypothetical protein
MADLTPEQKRALEVIEGSLHRMAMKVLEAPESEREAVYEICAKASRIQRALSPSIGASKNST